MTYEDSPDAPPPQDGPYWRLDIRTAPESSSELLSRLLAERPAWDLFTAPWGLSMRHRVSARPGPEAEPPAPASSAEPGQSPLVGPDSLSSPDLTAIEGVLAKMSRAKAARLGLGQGKAAQEKSVQEKSVQEKASRPPAPPKATLTWLPGEAAEPLSSLGHLTLVRPPEDKALVEGQASPEGPALAETKAGPSERAPRAAERSPFRAPELIVPREFQPSPRLRAWLSLALSAMAAHLSPPPGAFDTKGRSALIFGESPAILSAAAKLAGSGQISLLCSSPEGARLTQAVFRLNNLGGGPDVLPLGLPPWPASKMKDLAGRFGLIVASHSAHLMVRAVRALASWLEPSRGRIIITGIPSGSQASHLIKSASKAGLLIVETALDGPWAVMTMALRRPAKAAVWEWSPGDWLAELDEEDREALARIEALEKSGRGQKSLREKAVFGGDERQGTRLETEEAAGQREEFELTDEGGPEDIEEL